MRFISRSEKSRWWKKNPRDKKILDRRRAKKLQKQSDHQYDSLMKRSDKLNKEKLISKKAAPARKAYEQEQKEKRLFKAQEALKSAALNKQTDPDKNV